MSRRPRLALAAIGCAAALTACGDPTTGTTAGQGGAGGASAIGPSSDPVETGGLVWSAGSTVHLSDGTDVELGGEPERYAVGGDGVFFTTPDSGLEESAVASSALFLADRDGHVEPVAEAVDEPWASPDGEHLVYLDLGSGEKDGFGTPQVQVVVVDLVTGEEVVRSTEGAGDPGTDDFVSLYSESEIEIVSVTDDTAYVDLGAELEVDLDSGDVEAVEREGPGWDGPAYEDPPSPDGAWRVEQTDDVRDRLVGPGATTVVPEVGTPRWALQFWADDRTVVGVAIDGPVGPRQEPFSRDNTYELLSCTVPSGRCATVPGTAGETVRFPTGDSPTESTTLAFEG